MHNIICVYKESCDLSARVDAFSVGALTGACTSTWYIKSNDGAILYPLH